MHSVPARRPRSKERVLRGHEAQNSTVPVAAKGRLTGDRGVALWAWLRGGRPPRAPRSAGQHRTAADAGVGGQNLFSSQAGSGTRPAGEASSSGTAPQGRSEADIGKDAARRQQKSEGGRSSAERMMFASRGGCGSPSNCGASHGGRAAHLVEETAERMDYGCVREQRSDSEAAGPCELGQG